MMIHVRKDYLHLGFTYVSALVFVFVLVVAIQTYPNKQGGILAEEKIAQQPPMFVNREAFELLPITAKAYVVYDIVDKKVIASHNSTTTLPLASLTKVMTALTAHSIAEDATLVRIEPGHIDGAYDLGLRKGQMWRLDELLKYTLTFSSNDGAYAVADSLIGRESFIARMNTLAQGYGLGLVFTDPAGLDDGTTLGGKGSAYDVAVLMAIARREIPSILEATTKKRSTVMTERGPLSGIPNTNQSVAGIIGIEGSKTGYTDLAGGNLALIADVAFGHPVVIVVLGSTKAERFTDVEMLYEALLVSLK
jgi:D-alanyl-D-alanine carboxypeptidase (penicillin-binding protein 5/6)